MVVAWSLTAYLISIEVGYIVSEPTTPFIDRQPPSSLGLLSCYTQSVTLCSLGFTFRCPRCMTSTRRRPLMTTVGHPWVPVTPVEMTSLLCGWVPLPWLRGRGSTAWLGIMTLWVLRYLSSRPAAAMPPGQLSRGRQLAMAGAQSAKCGLHARCPPKSIHGQKQSLLWVTL
jgi:hypothetical protein